jgi:type II secretory pathway pseudopilin PulG
MREQRGVSLVETVLAVGILGLALTAGLNAFSALAQSAGHLDRAVAAEAVAHSVGESILQQAYVSYPGAYSSSADVANPRGYTVAVQIEYASNPAGVNQTTPPTWTTAPATDYGLQRITVTVTPLQGGGARVTRLLKRR